MKYQITQKIIAIGDDFSIADENGRQQYFVDGYGFSFGKKLSFQDNNKNQLLLIKKSLFTFMPKFNIFKNGTLYATVRKKWLTFRPSFVIEDRQNKDIITITGRIFDYEYDFYRKGQPIAQASKKWFRISDTYAVDLKGKAEPTLILSAAIIVDLILHNK